MGVLGRGEMSDAQWKLYTQLRDLKGDTLAPPPGRAAAGWWRTVKSLMAKEGRVQTNGYVVWLVPVAP